MIDYHHADEVLRSREGHSLWIGDVQAAENISWLQEKNIRTVITAAVGFRFAYDHSIKHFVHALEDRKDQEIGKHLDLAASQIDKSLKSGSVLVHCGAGVSRSPTLVIAYLIKNHQMSFSQALKLLKSKRPVVCPNLGFELQLKAYQHSHKEPLTSNIIPRQHRLKQLPKIVKYNPVHTSYGSWIGHRPNLSMSKSLRPIEEKEKKEEQYLRKMAQFRFGITNMSKWRLSKEQKLII